MSAVAGPGPSSMASSPIVPGSAKQLRIKKRVVNLVNPADPEDFSMTSESSNLSLRASLNTSTVSMNFLPTSLKDPRFEFLRGSTPLNDGVRGILRPTGTPGSGNGVRFFPKNKFRIITPNASITLPSTPQKTSNPVPPSPTNSFFSQLLAVSFPSSPFKSTIIEEPEPVSPPAHPDESWEVPGQEGEVSLVASSIHSVEQSYLDESQDYVETETEVWSGQPEIISSPLTLPPSDMSAEISQIVELPSQEWNLPEDMSNLLSMKIPSGSDASFSLSMMNESPPAELPRREISQRDRSGWTETEESSQSSAMEREDSNPTIRRQLTPSKDQSITQPGTPVPAIKPYTSIFADMSAEQAEMSWPMTRRDADESMEEAVFHSVVDISRMDNKPETPRNGDTTQYFDCAAFTPSALSASSKFPIIAPTTALVQAQTAHTAALTAEIQLYRSLADKLHSEVSERDSLLRDLHLRALKADMLETETKELREELKLAKSRQSSPSPIPDSPLFMKGKLHAGDRTTIVQAEVRDMEIRLAKAIVEQENTARLLRETQEERNERVKDLEEERQKARDLEDRERDMVVQLQMRETTGRENQDSALAQERKQWSDKIAGMEKQMEELRNVKIGDEEEIDRLSQSLNKARGDRKRNDETRERLRDLERDLDAESARRLEVERKLDEVLQERSDIEDENKELQRNLQNTRSELSIARSKSSDHIALQAELHTARAELSVLKSKVVEDSALRAEIARLRMESSSKNLEINKLQRRKAELKEDREMLSIALDSKQQELELVKRRHSVRGVAGNTPLAPSQRSNIAYDDLATPVPGRSRSRKSSAAFVTPGLQPQSQKHLFVAHRQISQSTMPKQRAMSRVTEENKPEEKIRSPAPSLRRERMLA